MSKLTNEHIQNIVETGKYFDGQGLYLYVLPSGGKSWRIDYSFEKRRTTLTLGLYPTISLEEARNELLELKRKIKDGIDPSIEKAKLKHTSKIERKKIEMDNTISEVEKLLTRVEKLFNEIKEYSRSSENA